jgi:hypothetical protein
MAGTRGKVSRIPIAAALVVFVVAGCGGGAGPQKSALHGVPNALAQDWAGQASEIAAAAAARNDCHAQALANSLRAQVMQKRHLLPPRLRSPLVTGLDSLVARTTCTQTAPAPPSTRPAKPHGPPKPTKPHGHHDHHGHGNDQGGDHGGDG